MQYFPQFFTLLFLYCYSDLDLQTEAVTEDVL